MWYEGLLWGTGTCVEVRAPPSRTCECSVPVHSVDPTPDLEVEVSGGSGGCSADRDPDRMAGKNDSDWEKDSPRGGR